MKAAKLVAFFVFGFKKNKKIKEILAKQQSPCH